MSLNKEFSSLQDKTMRDQWIIDQFTGLGLEVYTQNFTIHRPITGDKVSGRNDVNFKIIALNSLYSHSFRK